MTQIIYYILCSTSTDLIFFFFRIRETYRCVNIRIYINLTKKMCVHLDFYPYRFTKRKHIRFHLTSVYKYIATAVYERSIDTTLISAGILSKPHFNKKYCVILVYVIHKRMRTTRRMVYVLIQ